MNGTETGHTPHRQEATVTNSSDARCACGDRADGYDARRGEAVCGDCARLRADGGTSLYDCDTPGCTNLKEVVTPDGYVCHDCADELAEEYEDWDNRTLIADGGRSPEERQADALEAITEEMRYQNAVLCELLSSMDDLSQRVDEHHPDPDPPSKRSLRRLQTDVFEHRHERMEYENGGLL